MEEHMRKVQAAFRAAFGVDPDSIHLETKPGDILPWDSMGHVALVSSLEKEFGLTFDVDEVMEMENVRQILRIVQHKLTGQKS